MTLTLVVKSFIECAAPASAVELDDAILFHGILVEVLGDLAGDALALQATIERVQGGLAAQPARRM